MESGAHGGKLLGAGGGGFLYFIAPPYLHDQIVKKTGLRKVDFKIEKEGSKVIYET
jgi:D-glycero-alpha-D-manno-heptose-7-phosphate kinase